MSDSIVAVCKAYNRALKERPLMTKCTTRYGALNIQNSLVSAVTASLGPILSALLQKPRAAIVWRRVLAFALFG